MIYVFLVIVILLLILVVLFIAYQKEEKLSHINISEMRIGSKRTIFYHEDDFCQVEVIPFENLQDAKFEAQSIIEFSSRNFNGNGFDNIKVRNPHKVLLDGREIARDELDAIFKNVQARRHLYVATGSGQTEISSSNTIGYGTGYSAIYFNFNANEVVENIWMTNIRTFHRDGITSALHEIGTRWNLILVDWNECKFIALNNLKEIERYLEYDASQGE